jgi:hypothetical protein
VSGGVEMPQLGSKTLPLIPQKLLFVTFISTAFVPEPQAIVFGFEFPKNELPFNVVVAPFKLIALGLLEIKMEFLTKMVLDGPEFWMAFCVLKANRELLMVAEELPLVSLK